MGSVCSAYHLVIDLSDLVDSDEKGREHDARGLKTSMILIPLRDSDLAGLDVLGFGQIQHHETLIDFRADFVSVD